jgi:hypothetical protein
VGNQTLISCKGNNQIDEIINVVIASGSKFSQSSLAIDGYISQLFSK